MPTESDCFLFAVLHCDLRPLTALNFDDDTGAPIESADGCDFVTAWTRVGMDFGIFGRVMLSDVGAIAEEPPRDIRWALACGTTLSPTAYESLRTELAERHASLVSACEVRDELDETLGEDQEIENPGLAELARAFHQSKRHQCDALLASVANPPALGYSPSTPDRIYALGWDTSVRLYGRITPYPDVEYVRRLTSIGASAAFTPLQRMALSFLEDPSLQLPHDWTPTARSLDLPLDSQDDRLVGSWLDDLESQCRESPAWATGASLRSLTNSLRDMVEQTATWIPLVADGAERARGSEENSLPPRSIDDVFRTFRDNLGLERGSEDDFPEEDFGSQAGVIEFISTFEGGRQSILAEMSDVAAVLEAARLEHTHQSLGTLFDTLEHLGEMTATFPGFVKHFQRVRHIQFRAMQQAEALCVMAWTEIRSRESESPVVEQGSTAPSLSEITSSLIAGQLEPIRICIEHMAELYANGAHPTLTGVQAVGVLEQLVRQLAGQTLKYCRGTSTSTILKAISDHIAALRTDAERRQEYLADDHEHLQYCVNVARSINHVANRLRHELAEPLPRQDVGLLLHGILVLLDRIEKHRA